MKKIQLWSDEGEKEFAVCILGEQDIFRASTNSKARYTKIIEEAEYMEGEKYDWAYLLGRWIDNRGGNWIGMASPEGAQTKPAAPHEAARKKRRAPAVTALKCHFCGLMYSREKERGMHEKAWHAAKLGKA